MQMLSASLDLLLCGLLTVLLACGWRLMRTLSRMKRDVGQMEELGRILADSARRADMAVQGLRLAAQEHGARLQACVTEAKTLAGELEGLVERARVYSGRTGKPLPGQPNLAAMSANDREETENKILGLIEKLRRSQA